MRFRLLDAQPVPDVFAAVMATGIVSVAAEDHRYLSVSYVLAGVAIVSLVVLFAVVVTEWIVAQQFPFELSDPDVAVRLFTFVAACAVLGARLEAHPAEIWTLAVIAWLAWLLLVPITVRSMRAHRWTGLRDRAHGVWELASVAISGLAIVTAHLALLTSSRALLALGLAIWVLAIGVYCVMTWLIVWRAAARPADEIWRPDSWVLMGGLAIATLAGDRLHGVAMKVIGQDWLVDGVRWLTVGTWAAATLWIPLLVYTTLRHFELRFTGAWWGTVFPLGMYASATFAMQVETGWGPFREISLVFFWIALVAWTLVAASALVEFRRIQTR